ncbi:deuterolysin M35 metalloprotease [Rhizoctonia solani 123E]|uniref:Deuterolysin M35 metalloprotease n=2 Tax=Rhizoctonia solani TaxID=456999 RepID=A0A074S1J0_9AGAM|nr:deuterolysin M35 metalloprotease [Rhizoctonia solani 123E]
MRHTHIQNDTPFPSGLFAILPPGVMLTFVIAVLVASCGIVLSTPSLTLSISVPKSASSVDELSVTATITNTGKYPLKLLNHPQTVLSHLPTRVFDIRRGNDTPEFTGMAVHYSPDYVIQKNNSVDFTFLAPGQTSKHVHALAGVYNFTRVGTGEYQIEGYHRFHHVDASGQIASFDAETQPVRFELTGGLARSQRIALKSTGFSNGPTQMLQSACTPDQQNMITEAATYADQFISDALAYLQITSRDTPRYGTWFGMYDSQRIETVKSHYASNLGRAMLSSYDCMPDSCQDGSVAYVWRQRPGVIYFCNWFWARPSYGSNSKAGTIIHELSHFAGTEDYVYGEVGSMDLARSAPLSAVMNADSHMYFAENFPALQ